MTGMPLAYSLRRLARLTRALEYLERRKARTVKDTPRRVAEAG